MTVIHQQIAAAPVVVVDVWVRAGAIVEPQAWSGMAHFLEHMIFKGTDRLSPGAFDQIIENRGGMTNAATSHDYAHYFIYTTAPHLAETLPVLADLLLNAKIPDEEFDRERDVVLEEIRQANDDPDYVSFQALMESVYPHHPYGRPVLGDVATLMDRSPGEMRRFHRHYYQPENMTVVIAGDVDRQTAIDLVQQEFSHFPPKLDCLAPLIVAESPILRRNPCGIAQIRRQELHLPRLEQARLLMAWVGSGVGQLRDAYGLDLLSMVLAGGRSSQLVRELREEKQLVQAIGSSFSLQRDSSLFTVSVWLEPEDVEEVEQIIVDRMIQLADQPISLEELRRHQRLLSNDYAFSTETASQLAGLYGYYETIAQANLSIAYPQVIQSFRPEEIQQLARQYLGVDRYAVTVVKPV